MIGIKTTLTKFWLGVYAYKKAFVFTKTHRLGKYYILPAFLNLLIFGGIGVLGYFFVGDIVAWIEASFHIDAGEEWWLKTLRVLVSILAYVVAFFIYFKSYKYLMLILLSPVLSIVAGKVQEILHPNRSQDTFQLPQFLQDLKRGLIINLTNLAIELAITVPLIILGIVFSFISPFTTILVVLVEAYFIGFGMIDLRNEFMRLSIKESRAVVRSHRGFSLGIGLTMYVMLWVPLLGILLAPVWACIAAGLGIFELEEKIETRSSL